MKKQYLFFSIIAIAIFYAHTTFGWGKEGHRMVGEVAMHYAAKPISDSVKKYLDGMSIDNAATWMDDMRSNASLACMKPWHYVNVDKGKTYVPTDNPNIINQIERVYNELRNRKGMTHDQINMDIKVLIHLMGDLHQPLHVGYGIDQGGNKVPISFGGGYVNNLHAVWDEGIIDTTHINLQKVLAQHESFTATQLTKLEQYDVIAWLNEGRAFLAGIYNFHGSVLPEAYIDKNSVVIEKQILIGGLRLSAMLNEIFKK